MKKIHRLLEQQAFAASIQRLSPSSVLKNIFMREEVLASVEIGGENEVEVDGGEK
jgi:hypothetical protein